jgi:hypothetical protein
MKLEAQNSKLKNSSKFQAPAACVDATPGDWSLEFVLNFER